MLPIYQSCPSCSDPVNNETNRLVIENCGHKKCRQCFIREDLGCIQCRSMEPSPFGSKIIVLNNVQENTLTTVEASFQTNEKVTFGCRKTTKRKIHPLVRDHQCKKLKDISHISSYASATDPNVTLYKCGICNKEFKSLHTRVYHMYCDKRIEKPYKCKSCLKAFVSLAYFKYHRKTHSTDKKTISCTVCGKLFLSMESCKAHSRSHSGKKPKFTCTQCPDISYFKLAQLLAHKDRHDNTKRFKCVSCNQGFRFKHNLIKHQEIHQGGKLFACKNCDKKFSRNSTLTEHIRVVHNKESIQKYRCSVCHKSFSHRRALDRHFKIHNSEEKIFKCTLCPISSRRKDNIKRHVKNLHPDSDFTATIGKILSNYQSEIINEFEDTGGSDDTKTTNGTAVSVIKFACGISKIPNEIIPHNDFQNELDIPISYISHPIEKFNPNIYQQLKLNTNPYPTDEIPDNIDHSTPSTSKTYTTNIQIYRQILSPYLKSSTIEPSNELNSISIVKEPEANCSIERNAFTFPGNEKNQQPQPDVTGIHWRKRVSHRENW